MHAIGILVALGGLGCQNPEFSTSQALPDAPALRASVISGSEAWRAVSIAGMPPAGQVYGGGHSWGYPGGNGLRSTLISCILGHDDDVRSAREIEDSFFSRGSPD
jgi:hypothetical protein